MLNEGHLSSSGPGLPHSLLATYCQMHKDNIPVLLDQDQDCHIVTFPHIAICTKTASFFFWARFATQYDCHLFPVAKKQHKA